MKMYYDDHLAVAKTEIRSSNFCNLVDAAVMLYEDEHRRGKIKCHTKTLSRKKEEESDKRFFHLFPRKTRTSVKNFVPRQKIHENLNGASTSTSTSSLLHRNLIPVDSVTKERRDPLSSSLLGAYKITPPSETKIPQNPNPSPTLLVTAESSELTNPSNTNSPSSSCLTETTSSKRPAVQEIKQRGRFKKAKVAPLSWKGRETPERLIQLMRDMNGAEPRLIFEKTLTETDVNPGQSRLLMPFNTLIRNDFLTSAESRIVEADDNMGIGAILVDQHNVKWGLIFQRRDMKKKSGNESWNYAFISGWNDIVEANGFKDGDCISVWSFRWRQILCFAIVLPPTH